MAEKVTIMVLKVDLQCLHCRKKIDKILCKFPEIRDQKYDEKQNTVTIRVVCSSPEKIHDKLCCKGGKTIQCIILPSPPPPPAPAPPLPPPPPPAPPAVCTCTIGICCPPPPPPVCGHPIRKCCPPPPPPPPPVCRHPTGICCQPCCEGRTGACCHGCGVPPPPPPGPCCGSYGHYGGYGMGYCVTRSDFFCEENPSACTIM